MRAAATVITVVGAMTVSGIWSAAAAECGLLGLLCPTEPTTTAPPAAEPPGQQLPPPGQPPPEEQPAPPPPPEPAPERPGFILSPEGDLVPPPPAPDASGPDAPPPVPGPGEPVVPLPGDGEEPPPDAGPFPDHLRRLQNSVRRTSASNTSDLIAALAPLGQYGVSPQEAALIGFGSFPVAGEANYSHDWWYPRFGPGWRLHMGTDIFAAMGTPVRAPSDGRIRISNSNLGGLAVYVVQGDGTYWYLAHLSGIAEGIVEGSTVTVGQVVGFVGDSGNARGGSPHVHAEYHPGGGSAVDPKAILDQYLADAIAAAPALIQRYADAAATDQAIPSVLLPGVADPRSYEAPRSTLLWATAMSPSGGAMALAEAEAARVAGSVDWTAFETRQDLPAISFDSPIPPSLRAVMANS